MAGGEVPDPRRAVAQDGELADVPGAAAAGLGGHQDPELRRGGEGGQVGRGTRVADRVAVVVCGGLGEHRGHLDLAGAGPAVLALARPGRRSRPRSSARRCRRSRYTACPAAVPAGGSRLSRRPSIAAAPASITAAAARPSASARRPARLPVRVIPASSLTRRAAAANGTAAAARAVIFRSPGDMPCPATPSSSSRGASPCMTLTAVIPGPADGDRAEHRVHRLVPVAGERRLVAGAAVQRAARRSRRQRPADPPARRRPAAAARRGSPARPPPARRRRRSTRPPRRPAASPRRRPPPRAARRVPGRALFLPLAVRGRLAGLG